MTIMTRRRLRGGSWYDYPSNIRSSKRLWNVSDYRISNIGFRVVVFEVGHSPVLRGGCWFIYPRHLRSAKRLRYGPDNRDDIVGFRITTDSDTKP